MSLIFANIIGWIVAHKRLVVGAVAILFLVIVIGLVVRSCGKSPKLDQKEILKAQQAIEKEDRKVMLEILSNSDVKEQAIDSNIKLIEQATEEAKKNYTGLSNQELAAELERRSKE